MKAHEILAEIAKLSAEQQHWLLRETLRAVLTSDQMTEMSGAAEEKAEEYRMKGKYLELSDLEIEHFIKRLIVTIHSPLKRQVLLSYLKSFYPNDLITVTIPKPPGEDVTDFFDSVGLLADWTIDAHQLRKDAWRIRE